MLREGWQVVTEEEADRREKIYAEKQLYLSFDVENEDTAQYTIDTTIVGNAARLVAQSLVVLLCDI